MTKKRTTEYIGTPSGGMLLSKEVEEKLLETLKTSFPSWSYGPMSTSTSPSIYGRASATTSWSASWTFEPDLTDEEQSMVQEVILDQMVKYAAFGGAGSYAKSVFYRWPAITAMKRTISTSVTADWSVDPLGTSTVLWNTE